MKRSVSFVLAAALCGSPAFAQTPVAVPAALPSTAPPPSLLPVPGELELSKLVWSTMAAIDHANISGNYSVLRDLASPAFQIANDPAQLTAIFTSLRTARVDLSNTLLLVPIYTQPPAIQADNVLVLNGFFGLRPTAIQFKLQYQWVQGRWRLYGVSIDPASLAPMMPGSAPAAPPPDSRRPH